MSRSSRSHRLKYIYIYYRWPVFLVLVTAVFFIYSVYFIINRESSSAGARTSRELGSPPPYSSETIELWMLFYTNLQRADHNLPPFVISHPLREASRWQSAYSAELGYLNHFSKEPGMENAGRRIKFFSGRTPEKWAENLTVVFQSDMAGVTFRWKSDSEGKYKDFGNRTVRWLSETEIAQAMVVSVMNSETHRVNVLNEAFSIMGPGAVSRPFRGEAAFWAGQVFADSSPEKGLSIRNFAFRKTRTESGVTEFRMKLFNQPDLRPVVFGYGSGRITELLGTPDFDSVVFSVPEDDDADTIYRFGAKDPVNRIYYPVRRIAWSPERYP